MEEDRNFQKEAEEVAIKAGKNDDVDKNEKDKYSKSPYNGNFEAYAIDKMAVYQCYECKKAYPAGRQDCGAPPSHNKEDCF